MAHAADARRVILSTTALAHGASTRYCPYSRRAARDGYAICTAARSCRLPAQTIMKRPRMRIDESHEASRRLMMIEESLPAGSALIDCWCGEERQDP